MYFKRLGHHFTELLQRGQMNFFYNCRACFGQPHTTNTYQGILKVAVGDCVIFTAQIKENIVIGVSAQTIVICLLVTRLQTYVPIINHPLSYIIILHVLTSVM